MGEISTRNATKADVDALMEFWAEAGENGSRPDDRPDLITQLLDHDPEAILVAEVDGLIVATIVSGWDGWRANLYRLAVAPHWRGRGLGRRMLALAEERLRGLGAERFCAMVLDENDLGAALWRSAGYTPQDEWRRWVKPAT
ncbi:GNAT family N-acetyltransferase [Nocardioides sp. GY 10127]|uniref:GNAT family N-acetyltransferase n=1 Tax=Nocardioides sp. GY 10127 TaxID=2569762 RepID=UPI0010A8D86D|nr:GNAT family N-acetyltransferase [Nocardioides sp. GY 10127]TIC81615.1 GNAT family N-acetyltransferase [Nocardioides sp. GY 10127]